MNQKCHHLVFLKILSTVTPECVVDRLRRNNVYIWLLKRIYSHTNAEHVWKHWAETRGNHNIWGNGEILDNPDFRKGLRRDLNSDLFLTGLDREVSTPTKLFN